MLFEVNSTTPIPRLEIQVIIGGQRTDVCNFSSHTDILLHFFSPPDFFFPPNVYVLLKDSEQ